MNEREMEHILNTIKSDKEHEAELDELYNITQRKIEKDIDAFMNIYAGLDNVSMQLAKKKATKIRMQEFYRDAEKIMEEQDVSARAREEANEDIRKYRKTEIELLFSGIGISTILLADKENKLLNDRLNRERVEEVKRQSKIIGVNRTLEEINKVAAERTVKGWRTIDFSESVWANQKELKAELEKTIRRVIINGENPKQASSKIREKVAKDFKQKKYAAERIARTESAFAQTVAQYESYKDMNVKHYQFIAEYSACDDCADLNGEVFEVSEMMAGVNAPYIHPNCKCSTAAHFDRESWDADLKARGL